MVSADRRMWSLLRQQIRLRTGLYWRVPAQSWGRQARDPWPVAGLMRTVARCAAVCATRQICCSMCSSGFPFGGVQTTVLCGPIEACSDWCPCAVLMAAGRVPGLVVRYAACGGLVNQQYCHIAGISAAIALGAETVVRPHGCQSLLAIDVGAWFGC